ncbi:HlyD family efflux transporter periplasmic adaptor subunit [Escherichia coli]|nr:HlyD family efflux transporter periplasmic adaptor subunit [Escherichia coli]HAX4366964.1 HlyD family efflux transporter periplasmic adaptor subunit [Escherichia coli]
MKRIIKSKVSISVFILTILLIMLSAFKIDIVTPGTGVISGASDKIEVTSPSSGLINEFSIKKGQQILPGDVLFSYTNLDVFYKEKSLRDLLELNGQKYNNLLKDLELLSKLLQGNFTEVESILNKTDTNTLSELSSYRFYTEHKALEIEKSIFEKKKESYLNEKNALSIQKDILNTKAQLLNKSQAPAIDKLNNQLEISKLTSQINSQEMSFLSSESDINNKNKDYLSRLIDKINEVNNRIYEFRKNNKEQHGEAELLKNKIIANTVVSPVQGVILDVERNLTNNSYIETNQKILTIKKSHSIRIIDAKFDARYRPFIYTSGKVKISVDSPGFKKTLSGKITKISADSFLDEKKGDNIRYYEVEITPNEQQSITPEYEGVQVRVFAISKKISILNYLTALVNDSFTFNVW